MSWFSLQRAHTGPQTPLSPPPLPLGTLKRLLNNLLVILQTGDFLGHANIVRVFFENISRFLLCFFSNWLPLSWLRRSFAVLTPRTNRRFLVIYQLLKALLAQIWKN